MGRLKSAKKMSSLTRTTHGSSPENTTFHIVSQPEPQYPTSIVSSDKLDQILVAVHDSRIVMEAKIDAISIDINLFREDHR